MRILMVCLGNICRSPLAQGILEEKFRQHNINGQVDSAGTAAYHEGEPPDSRSRKVAREHDIDISSQRARAFTIEDFDLFDQIYVMDNENYTNIRALARDARDLEKVELIMNEAYPGENRQVPDPYYGGGDGFEKVYQMLDKASHNIVEKILTSKD
ncbi:MAG: low molecular weight protein-tyrosine-phosphatase [Bacteroidales bacterium]